MFREADSPTVLELVEAQVAPALEVEDQVEVLEVLEREDHVD